MVWLLQFCSLCAVQCLRDLFRHGNNTKHVVTEQILLARGALVDLRASTHTALIFAAERGHSEICKVINYSTVLF